MSNTEKDEMDRQILSRRPPPRALEPHHGAKRVLTGIKPLKSIRRRRVDKKQKELW